MSVEELEVEVEESEVDGQETDGENEEDSTQETPTLEDVLKKNAELQKSLDKANRERTRLGKKVKETKETPEVPAISDAAKRVLVITALQAEGLNKSQASRLSKLYDLSDVDVEDDEVTGIDFDDLKDEFPELFTKSDGTTPKKTVRKVDTANKKNTAPPSALSDATKRMMGFE